METRVLNLGFEVGVCPALSGRLSRTGAKN